MYVCAPHTYLMSLEARESVSYPGPRVKEGFKLPLSVLGIEPGSSVATELLITDTHPLNP